MRQPTMGARMQLCSLLRVVSELSYTRLSLVNGLLQLNSYIESTLVYTFMVVGLCFLSVHPFMILHIPSIPSHKIASHTLAILKPLLLD